MHNDPIVWRDIPQYPRYQVSSTGKIRSIDVRDTVCLVKYLRAHRQPRHPYPVYRLTISPRKRASVYAHSVVNQVFNGPRPFKGAVTRHLDGNTMNNNAYNLAWGTPSENVRDSIRHGTYNYEASIRTLRENSLKQRKLSMDDARYIRQMRGIVPVQQLSAVFKVSVSTVEKVQAGLRYND